MFSIFLNEAPNCKQIDFLLSAWSYSRVILSFVFECQIPVKIFDFQSKLKRKDLYWMQENVSLCSGSETNGRKPILPSCFPKNVFNEIGNNSGICSNKPLCSVSHPHTYSACANIQSKVCYFIKVAFYFEKCEFGSLKSVEKTFSAWLIEVARSTWGKQENTGLWSI